MAQVHPCFQNLLAGGKVERVKKNQSCLRKQNNHTGFHYFFVYLKKNTPHFAFEKLDFFLAKLTGAKEPWEHFLIFWGKKDIGSVICNTEK